MKTITMFYLENCPYCKNARKALKELTEENPEYGSISVDMIEESQNPEKADAYDYYYVPALFLENEKAYEAAPSEDYASIRSSVERVLKRALNE